MVGDIKPGVETLEVALDGGEAQVQLIGDLTVGLAGAKGAQHLELARSERLGEGLLTLPGGRLVEWIFPRLVFFLQLPEQPVLQHATRPRPDGDVVVGEKQPVRRSLRLHVRRPFPRREVAGPPPPP